MQLAGKYLLLFDNFWTSFAYALAVFFNFFAIKVYAVNENSKNRYYQKQGRILLTFSVLSMIVFATLRDITVGTDTVPYVERFLDADLNSGINWEYVFTLKTGEPLFFILNALIRTVTDNYHLYFFSVYAFITIAFTIFLSKTYKEYASINIDSKITFYLPIILAGTYFIHSWNVMRSWLAISVTLFAFIQMIEGKKWQSLAIIFVATMIHYSAVCFIFAWLLFFLDKDDRILSNKILSFAIAFGGMLFIYGSFTVIKGYFLSTKYKSYVDSVSNWTSFAPGLIVAVGAILFSENLKKQGLIAKACVKLQPVKVAMMAFGFFGGSRIGYFFRIQDIYLISLLYSFGSMKFKSPVVRFVFRIIIIAFVLVIFINNMANMAETSGVFPYVLSTFELM